MLTFEDPPEPHWKNPSEWRLGPTLLLVLLIVVPVVIGIGVWIVDHAADIAAVVLIPLMLIQEFLPKTDIGWLALLGGIAFAYLMWKLNLIIDLLTKDR